MHWLEAAQKLPEGQSERFYCCGKDKGANIFHTEDGYSLYCFRDSDHNQFHSHGYRNYKELLEVKKRNAEALKVLQSERLQLPRDFTLDIPPEGMLWLLKASITPYMARQFGFGWTPYFQRVILPVHSDGKLVYYQARAVLKGQDPKYLNPKVDRASILYWRRHSTDMSRVIITEDILSAARVGKHINTVSLLGTKITPQQANQIAEYEHVTTWLDPDKAGIEGGKKIRKILGLATKVSNIITPKDPKLLSDMQIREQLWNNVQ